MKNTLLAILFSALALGSCNQADLIEVIKPLIENKIPYSTQSQLHEFSDDPDIVDYVFARQLAIVDITINNTFQDYGWVDCTLSSEPIIVYYFDNKPLYYDFIVLDQAGTPKGSVSVHARKTEVMQIAQIGTDLSQYNAIAGGSTPNNVFFADKSGHRYIANRNQTKTPLFSGKDAQTGEIITSLKPITDEDKIETLKTEILQQVYDDPQELDQIVASITERVAELKKEAAMFWELANQNKEDIMSFTKSQVYAQNLTRMFKNTQISDIINNQPDTIVESTPIRRKLTINQSKDKKLTWINEFEAKSKIYGQGSFCGQYGCAFILGAYGYKTIKTDSIRFEIGKGPMRVRDLSRVLARYSNNYLGVHRTERSAWDVYWYIIQNKTPSFKLTTSHGELHWTIIYGCYRVKRMLTTKYYFMQIDNGAIIGDERYKRRPDDPASYTSLGAFDLLYDICD